MKSIYHVAWATAQDLNSSTILLQHDNLSNFQTNQTNRNMTLRFLLVLSFSYSISSTLQNHLGIHLLCYPLLQMRLLCSQSSLEAFDASGDLLTLSLFFSAVFFFLLWCTSFYLSCALFQLGRLIPLSERDPHGAHLPFAQFVLFIF